MPLVTSLQCWGIFRLEEDAANASDSFHRFSKNRLGFEKFGEHQQQLRRTDLFLDFPTRTRFGTHRWIIQRQVSPGRSLTR